MDVIRDLIEIFVVRMLPSKQKRINQTNPHLPTTTDGSTSDDLFSFEEKSMKFLFSFSFSRQSFIYDHCLDFHYRWLYYNA